MSKGKASKNNIATRQKMDDVLYQGKKIKPVKLVTKNSSYLAAEFDGSGDLVMDSGGIPMPWAQARDSSQ